MKLDESRRLWLSIESDDGFHVVPVQRPQHRASRDCPCDPALWITHDACEGVGCDACNPEGAMNEGMVPAPPYAPDDGCFIIIHREWET